MFLRSFISLELLEAGSQKLEVFKTPLQLLTAVLLCRDEIQFLPVMAITPCLCLWAGLYTSHRQQSIVVQLKIVRHWLQSNKLSAVLNFLPLFQHLWEIISYISAPLRCLLKSCQSVQSNSRWCCPISVTRQAREQYSSPKKKTQRSALEIHTALPFCGLWVCKSGFSHGATKLSLGKV